MTTDEMITNLRSLLGDIGDVLDAEILVELKIAQTIAERGPTLPWFLIKDKLTTATIDENRVEIPNDFLREAEYDALAILDTGGDFYPLQKLDLDKLRAAYAGEASGEPCEYSLLGKYFWVFPAPSRAATIKMQYYARDTTLATGDSGNFWSTYYPDLLMGLAGLSLTLHQRALDIQPRFEQMASIARQQMATDNTVREVANREVIFSRDL